MKKTEVKNYTLGTIISASNVVYVYIYVYNDLHVVDHV